MIDGIVMLKGLVAALVVGFVTASIRTWVDRFFLLIMLVGIVGLPIGEAILVNLVVVSLSAFLMLLRQRKALSSATSVQTVAFLIVAAAVAGGIAGRIIGAVTPPKVLLGALGVYAVLVGLRILLIKPLSEREAKAHPAWSALATQFGLVAVVSLVDLVLGLYEFALVTFVALLMNRLWSEKLDRIVNLTIAPILIIVGVRFIVFAL